MANEKGFSESAIIMNRLAKDNDKYPFTPAKIKSHDGLTLFAKVYDGNVGSPVEILFHGYRGSSAKDMCGGLYLARENNHNIILVDQRSHGLSEGKSITFGVKERLDALKWIDFAIERYGENVPIIIAGISMGASTVLMASGENLPKNVKAIIADSPFSSPKEIIKTTIKNLKFPVVIAYPFVYLSGLIFARFNIEKTTVKDMVKKSKTPILLLHGEEDGFVPCKMSEEIFKSNEEYVTLHTFKGAGHGMSYLVDPVRYEGVINDFLTKVL
jgi:pimeloyl-ACP methyl ester carboxylesterase